MTPVISRIRGLPLAKRAHEPPNGNHIRAGGVSGDGMLGRSSRRATPRSLTLLAPLVLSACVGGDANEPPEAPGVPSRYRSPTAEAGELDALRLQGRIVLANEGDIWVMNADGTDRRRLTDDPAEDFDPVWSPDGRLIAFRSQRDGNEEIYVMKANGSGEMNLTHSPMSDYSPAWSPDGTRIAFATDRDADSGGNDIYVVDASGSRDPVRVTFGGGIDEYPSWSPDGQRLAFSCTGGRVLPGGVGDFEICVVNLATGNIEQLTDSPGISDHPAWSPDGRSIAFMSTRGGWPTLPDYIPPGYEEGRFGDYDIYVMDADGSNPRGVTRNGREDEQFPAWSPDGQHLIYSRYGCLVVSTRDGTLARQLTPDSFCADGFPDWNARDPQLVVCARWLAFIDERGGSVDLYVIRSDGTGRRRLTRDPAVEQYPTWSPDGTRIAFERRMGDDAEIWIWDGTTRDTRRLTRNPGIDWTPAWSPNGRRIAFASVRGGAALAIYTMTPLGTRIHRIPNTDGGAEPAWSPDGTRLAFRKELPGNDEIFVIDVDGTDWRNLTDNPANDFSPEWSPTGDRLVFESFRDGNYELYTVAEDGSDLQRLTDSQAPDQFPSWSPDGSSVVFSRLGELHVLSPPNTNESPRPLAEDRPINGNFPSWGGCATPTSQSNGSAPGLVDS